MATRAATFSAKIRTLKEYQARIVKGTSPTPSGVDVANNLKYFSQTLLSVLKEVPVIAAANYGPAQHDTFGLSLFPNLSYQELYQAISSIIDILPSVQTGQHVLGESLLNTIGCLVPFLETDLLETLPYTVISTLATFPSTLHKDIIMLLCTDVLPLNFGYVTRCDSVTYVTESVPSMIMLVLQYVANEAFHSMVVECLMTLKRNIYKDLIQVIAYGPSSVRLPAVNLLFFYFTHLYATTDIKSLTRHKFVGWTPLPCQFDDCPHHGNARAAMKCLDWYITTEYMDKAPPLYICSDCASSRLTTQHAQFFSHVLHPLTDTSLFCDSHACRSQAVYNLAVGLCFSSDCCSSNDYRPVRFCASCSSHHSTNQHMTQISPASDIWSYDRDMQAYTVDAIICLLKEANHLQEKGKIDGMDLSDDLIVQQQQQQQLLALDIDEEDGDSSTTDTEQLQQQQQQDATEEAKLMSRYGAWLIMNCVPINESVQVEILARLVAGVFEWFEATACLPDDSVGAYLDKIKTECLVGWLLQIREKFEEIILTCLVPHPPSFAKVGLCWETSSTRFSQIQQQLQRLLCLVPYQIVDYKVWDYVMTYWLEALRTEINNEERSELNALVGKMFDSELSPLCFERKDVYHFISSRCSYPNTDIQLQSLQWLQVLTMMEVYIPIDTLLSMFNSTLTILFSASADHQNAMSYATTAADSHGKGSNTAAASNIAKSSNSRTAVDRNAAAATDTAGVSHSTTATAPDISAAPDAAAAPDIAAASRTVLTVDQQKCFILILDILIQQLRIQCIAGHHGITGKENNVSEATLQILSEMSMTDWHSETDGIKREQCSSVCSACEREQVWYELAVSLLEFVAPVTMISMPAEELPDDQLTNNQQHDDTASQGDETEKLPVDLEPRNMPPHLRLLTGLLEDMKILIQDDNGNGNNDMLYLNLKCLNLLLLYIDCLRHTTADYQFYLAHCLDKKLIPFIWRLLHADHSSVSSLSVPLLVISLTKQSAGKLFWKIIEEDFNNEDWRVRFVAVEKVAAVSRFIRDDMIDRNQLIRSSLCHAFCYLIGSLDDNKSVVVQRAVHYLQTINHSAINCLCRCIELQFDSVIADRTLLLHKLWQLSVVLKDQRILTWDFFLSRFDALCLEAQLILNSRNSDISHIQDLYNNAIDSEILNTKVTRARYALSGSIGLVSLTSSCLSLGAGSSCRRGTSQTEGRANSHQQHMTQNAPVKTYSSTLHAASKYCSAVYESSSAAAAAAVRPSQCASVQFRSSRGSRLSSLGGLLYGNVVGGHLREFTDGESNFASLLQTAMDHESADKHTLYHLITLLMKFMVTCRIDSSNENLQMSKSQSAVLRHTYILLGYNQTEKIFNIPPYKLRCSVVFNAFMFGMARVLDHNFTLGNIILPVSLAMLQYCASPQRYASDYQPPNFTLWLLDQHMRHAWLYALLVILYKYQYNTSSAESVIETLITITVNTINQQKHCCQKNSDDLTESASPFIHRNRDTSNVSVGDLENIQETETPPQSPSAMLNCDYQTQRSDEGLGEDVYESFSLQTSVSSVNQQQLWKLISQQQQQQQLHNIDDNDSGDAELEADTIQPDVSATLASAAREKSVTTPTPPADVIQPSLSLETLTEADMQQQQQSTWLTQKNRRSLKGMQGKLQQQSRQISLSPTQTFVQQSQQQIRRIAEYNRIKFPLESNTKQLSSGSHTPGNVTSREELCMKSTPICKLLPLDSALEVEPVYSSTTTVTVSVSPSAVDSSAETASKSIAVVSPVEPTSVTTATNRVAATVNKGAASVSSVPRARSNGIANEGESLEEPGESRSESMKVNEIQPKLNELRLNDEDAHVDAQQYLECEDNDELIVDKPEELRLESDEEQSPCASPVKANIDAKLNLRQRRKTGLTTVEIQKSLADTADGFTIQLSPALRKARRCDMSEKAKQHTSSAAAGNGCGVVGGENSCPQMSPVEQLLVDQCAECGEVIESYDEDTISLAIICLSTFIHREPTLAAPHLLQIIQAVCVVAGNSTYPWQTDMANSSPVIPGNSVSIARQFIRCILHQLSQNNILLQIFLSPLAETDCLKTIISALVDFPDLSSLAALQIALEAANAQKSLGKEELINLLINLTTYVESLQLDGSTSQWMGILQQFEIFYRRLPAQIQILTDINPLLNNIITLLKTPALNSVRGILEPFSKLLSHAIQNCSFKLQQLLDICSLSGRAFTKERDKLLLARCAVYELTQAIKFKSFIPDDNLLLLVQLICLDAGGTLGSINIVSDLVEYKYNPYAQCLVSTNASDCMKHHLTDCLDFISDLHTINKVKNNLKTGGLHNLNEDTLGSHLKAGLAQYVALELTRASSREINSGSNSSRVINRYLPWLYHPPSTLQQGPREFVECVGRIRVLSWLLLGSLTHTAVTKGATGFVCQPLSLETSSYIADHIIVIMTGFAEQSKASVLHMSSLFHAFILCQLWTMYCESMAAVSNSSALISLAHQTAMDFWARVTPGILQLLSHSKLLAEMVNLHFLTLLEALQECNSEILTKLFSMWLPILHSYCKHLPGHMQVRLQMCLNLEPTVSQSSVSDSLNADTLLKWLKRLQFKLGQIEVQSSAAAQFYTV